MNAKHITLSILFLCSSVMFAYGGGQHLQKAERSNGMMFTPNKGQITDANKKERPDILYKGNGKGTDIYVRKNGISYVESNIGDVIGDINEEIDDEQGKGGKYVPKEEALREKMRSNTDIIKISRVDMDFVNASAQSEVVADEQVEGFYNYYLWNCPEGITHVCSYNELTVKNMYENIDVVYRGDKELGLKYTIMVYPGGNPSQIKMLYSGAQSMQVVKDELMIGTSLGTMNERLPEVYQIIDNRKVELKIKYKLENAGDSATLISYELSNYNPNYILIIDPWVTYYGGADDELGTSIATDGDGNIVFTGETNSLNFPVSVGAFQTTNLAEYGSTAFVVKMGANGNRIFGTYFGGNKGEYGMAISCDAANNIYVAGVTYSSIFPVGASTGNVVHQNTIGIDSNDAFLAKFDPTGIRLWATFYGGDSSDCATGVCIDKNSNSAILYGYTVSTNSIVTPGSYQTVNHGFGDAFVAKFASNGTRQWGTYIGGDEYENSANVCCDHAGNIFICGTTFPNYYDTTALTNDFPVLAGHQMTSGGGYDAFICKLNSAGTSLIWSSFYGGEDIDYGLSIAIDGNDNVFMGGYTGSLGSIATTDAYQTNYNGGFGDGFLVKFNNNGVRQWGTYLGGTGCDQGIGGISCDANNNIVTGGDTYSNDFPVTNCAYQKVFKGSEDQFISTFRPDGSLLCSGYMGLGDETSPNNETMQTQCIAIYGCYVYLYAFTYCNYPVTPDAFQSICGGGNWDAAVAKLYLNTCGGMESNADFSANSNICAGAPVSFSSSFTGCDNAGVTYAWSFPGGTPATSTEANPSGITYDEAGNYDVMLVINQSCGADTLKKSGYVLIKPCYITTLEPPNVFTPNGDGVNDTYKVKYTGPFENFKIEIFNRWGVKLYESNNIDAGWSCDKCADGTYFYIIEALGKDKQKYDLHGTITLL